MLMTDQIEDVNNRQARSAGNSAIENLCIIIIIILQYIYKTKGQIDQR